MWPDKIDRATKKLESSCDNLGENETERMGMPLIAVGGSQTGDLEAIRLDSEGPNSESDEVNAGEWNSTSQCRGWTEITPMKGMTFESMDALEEFYSSYAKATGFKVTKGSSAKDSVTKERRFQYWHCECGPPNKKKEDNGVVKAGCRRKKSKKCGCEAGVSGFVNKEGRWEIYNVELTHKNHIPTPSQSQSIPSVRDVLDSGLEVPQLRVAYQGVPGAYSQLAAEKAYPSCEAVPCEQFETAFEAVENGHVDCAVLPIENSLGGSIHRNYDLLLRHSLHIIGEVKVVIRHCLLANHGVKLEDLKRVLSHPQALSQCENTLARFGLVREAADDTAGSAQYIANHQIKDAGAVASATAAKIYDLNVLAEDIQDNSYNITRFLMLARKPIAPSTGRPFKTSIVFALMEGPGALFKALAAFSLREINLTKIESRPNRDCKDGSMKCFNYLFYLDFEASMADKVAENAVRNLKEFASLVRVLGSYPSDIIIT